MLILQLLVFAMPVIFAGIWHMIAVKYNWLTWLKIPIDNYKTFRRKRIFGDSKTWRGVVLMTLFCVVGCYGLAYLTTHFEQIGRLNMFDFAQHSPLFYGILLGLGYTVAELPNSFWKRQNNIENGQRGSVLNVLIDQIDSAIGCLLFLLPFTKMSATFLFAGCVFFLFLHLFFNVLLYFFGLRKEPF